MPEQGDRHLLGRDQDLVSVGAPIHAGSALPTPTDAELRDAVRRFQSSIGRLHREARSRVAG